MACPRCRLPLCLCSFPSKVIELSVIRQQFNSKLAQMGRNLEHHLTKARLLSKEMFFVFMMLAFAMLVALVACNGFSFIVMAK